MDRWVRQIPLFILGLLTAPGTGFAELSTSEGKVSHAEAMAEGLVLFKDQVLGILTENCLECHGGEKIESDFDMSTRELLFASGLVTDSSVESDLIGAITHHYEPFMPHERDKLDEESIAAITRWIDLGAPYDKPLSDSSILADSESLVITDEDRNYWAYRTLSNPDVPASENDEWSRNEIDRFIFRKLEANGLSPNPMSPDRNLIRRAYLNAIGLPPTPEQVDEFVNDIQPMAYERMIDRLLESPHYGERWARHWMDIARFAESSGFEIDYDRPYAYHYRDFLIKAFNQNMSYYQFIRWQVAGDELASEDPLALMATGFLNGGVVSTVVTEKEFESSRYDELEDIVNTIGTAMLGTTVGCARCHDHKYDPISSKDYYQLASNFTRTVRAYVDHNPDVRANKLSKSQWTLEGQNYAAQLMLFEEAVLEKPFQSWMRSGAFQIPLERWLVLNPDTFDSREGSTVEKLWDDSLLLSEENPEMDFEVLTVESETMVQDMVGLRMETLTHPILPKGGPGRDHEGGFTIRELAVQIKDLGSSNAQWKRVDLKSAEATSQENDDSLGAAAAINQVTQGWSIDFEGFGKDQALVIRFAKPVGYTGGTRIKITVTSGFNIQQMVGRPRFSITQDHKAAVENSEGIPVLAYESLLKLLVGINPDLLRNNETEALRSWYGRTHPEWVARKEKLMQHILDQPKLNGTRILAASDSLPPIWHASVGRGYPSFYENTHYLERGDVTQKVEIATPGFPQVLVRDQKHFESEIKTSNPRSELAAWLTNTESGAGSLLARVFVNRIWHYHFGRGLVATPSDFGKQGGDPSHPELLEWLAHDFVEHGWDVKRLQKQIMTSAVYRQTSAVDPSKAQADVENTLLWRFPGRRVEAEVIRDSLLQVSGLLDRTQFGPGTRDPDMLRRSIYFFIKRAALIPEMTLFDWPEHLVGIGQRASTTIAPQALEFLNGTQTRRFAEGLAKRLSKDEGVEAQIKLAYQIVLNRFPKQEEITMGIEFLQTQQAVYRDQGFDENKALIDYCQSLLSLNEFLYIR
ncbi:MAG: DUF1549 domain-containing protein [Verrucomicrobia bacterium]|nr:DUF1549 domain-containing protein [Verrucomicrobiota bacterium]MDA1067489.1 DUF1549 domain-containing protein [Verrucomicrobiota bacterium]